MQNRNPVMSKRYCPTALARTKRRLFAAVAGLALILCFGRELSSQLAQRSWKSTNKLALTVDSESNEQIIDRNDQIINLQENQDSVKQSVPSSHVSLSDDSAAKATTNGITSNVSVSAFRPIGLVTITRRFWEGVGNQLFQFSTAYALGRFYKRQLTLRREEELLVTFQQLEQTVRVMSEADWNAVSWQQVNELHPSAFGLPPATVAALRQEGVQVRLNGYFQSFRYFNTLREEIVSKLVFAPNVRELVAAFISRLRAARNASAVQLVGVHIRRGDMVKDPQVMAGGYQVATPAFLADAASYFRKQFGERNVLFVVCSDDLDWSRSNFPVLQNDTVFMDDLSEFNGPPHFLKRARDLHLLSSLDHTIMTVGTFGWWAAYIRETLRNGTTIYFAHPYLAKSRLEYDFQSKLDDFYPSTWIPLG